MPERMPGRSLFVLLCIALLGALLPAATMAASEAKPREYIVTLAVADSGRVIQPSSRSARQRINRRSELAGNATDRLAKRHGFKTRFRYGSALTGFAANLTPEQAAELAKDGQVANVRPARRMKLAATTEWVPFGVKRVKAVQTGGSQPDVNAHVAVLDTGIGPARYVEWGSDDPYGVPLPMGPTGDPELNIRGGVNCFDDSRTSGINEAYEEGNPEIYDDYWADNHGHGTHVAGTIGARDNGVGTIGVAPGAKLWAVRVFQGSRGSEAAVLCGLEWAVSTHSNALPDIDVINMSMQSPRIDKREDCEWVLSHAASDDMQKGVCMATQIGITVVAAAGNGGYNANDVAPGGFDQVISVGAMTDFDGQGWGEAGSSGCDPSERDDTFAKYSNHGREVDIVAPGTCVRSTSPTTSGADYFTSTGTSMAAPHVTGAVARYLADHPGTSPERMRKLVRASGRMDWDAKTDPIWDGINDTNEPNRVLDVKALTGEALLKSWVYHDSFRVGGTDKSRASRVDVQRGGGYSGTANLDITGLPGAVGNATFDDASLAGLTGLGTNVHLSLKTNGPDGAYDLGVEVNGSGVSPFSRDLSLTVDRTGPDVDGLAPRLRAGVPVAASGATQTMLQWEASDALSNIKTIKLQRKTGTQAWRDAGTPGSSSSRVTLKKGQDNRFRVKAIDSLGNVTLTPAIGARLSVRDSKSSQVLKPASGGWKTKAADKAYGSSLLLATDATDSLVTGFTGKAVAVAGSSGPNRGSFRVRVDGGTWSRVSLTSAKAAHRVVVWSRKLEDGSHQLEIQGLDGQTALDAILIIR